MAKPWKSSPARPVPTSITEIARRYHAAALALSQTLGLSLSEVLTHHRESVTAIFIECGKCELRLPTGVKLPPLAAPVAQANGHHRAGDQPVGQGPAVVDTPPMPADAPAPGRGAPAHDRPGGAAL